MKSDSELLDNARMELVREPAVDAASIDVQIRDGVAILRGSVRSELEAWSAADAVMRVAGVRSVVNETMITRETPAHPADPDIARPWFPSG